MTSLQKLRNKMSAESVEAVLVTDLANVAWLTEFSGSAGMVLAGKESACFLTDGRYTAQASVEVRDMPVRVYNPPVRQIDFVAQNARDLGVSKIGFESENVTFATYQDWKGAFGEIELIPLNAFVSPLRMVKNASEIERLEQVCGIADAAFAHVLPSIQPGVREYDVMLELELFFRRQGAASAFDIIVASGARSALPHGRATEKVIEEGDLVTLDFGAKKDGLNSDITRTVMVGEPTARQREIYELVLKAEVACIEAIRPGMAAKDLDAIARNIFAQSGVSENFTHSLGHGLGRLVHDYGRLATSSTDTIEEGQVWTIEPGVYFDGWGGVRIEDDVVVTAEGARVLTKSPKELLVLPKR